MKGIQSTQPIATLLDQNGALKPIEKDVVILKESSIELSGASIRERFPGAGVDPEQIYNLRSIYMAEPIKSNSQKR